MSKEHSSGGADWEQTAAAYLAAEGGDVGHKVELCLPPLLEAFGDVREKIMIDYGCGDGWLCDTLITLGAARVYGIEKSSVMLDQARQRPHDPRIQFFLNPHNCMSTIADNSISGVISNLAFMHQETEEEMEHSFADVFRVLKPGGRFAYLIFHPAFDNRPSHNTERGAHPYMGKGVIYDVRLRNPSGTVAEWSDYHFPLSTYINVPTKVGFTNAWIREIPYTSEFVERNKAEIIAVHGRIPENFVTAPSLFVWSGLALKDVSVQS